MVACQAGSAILAGTAEKGNHTGPPPSVAGASTLQQFQCWLNHIPPNAAQCTFETSQAEPSPIKSHGCRQFTGQTFMLAHLRKPRAFKISFCSSSRLCDSAIRLASSSLAAAARKEQFLHTMPQARAKTRWSWVMVTSCFTRFSSHAAPPPGPVFNFVALKSQSFVPEGWPPMLQDPHRRRIFCRQFLLTREEILFLLCNSEANTASP